METRASSGNLLYHGRTCEVNGNGPGTERIRENIGIWDFELSAEEMERIAAMDTGRSDAADHFSPQTAKFLNGFKIHA